MLSRQGAEVVCPIIEMVYPIAQEDLRMNRFTEKGTMPSRRSRFYTHDGYWYYSTREGIDIGPFDSRLEAISGASSYIDFILHAEPEVLESINVYSAA